MAENPDGPQPIDAVQAAALELIGAARRFLDAAEHVVRDPEAVREAVASIAAVAKAVVGSVVARAGSASGLGEAGAAGEAERDGGTNGLERIDLT